MKEASSGCLDISVGARGSTIRLREETFGCSVFLLWPTPAHVNTPYYREKLPPIRDPEGKPVEERVRAALIQAQEASRLRFEGEQAFPQDEGNAPLRLTDLIQRFRDEELPTKRERRQREIERDLTCVEGFLEHEGRLEIPAEDVDVPMLKRLLRWRISGKIDAHGNVIEKEDQRRPVTPRTASETLGTVRQVYRWGKTLREGGENLLSWNPVDGMELPGNKNPTRVVCSDEKYEAILQVADRITIGHGDEKRRAPLKEIWIVTAYTGHRRSAVISLKWDDWRPDLGNHGVIRWRAESDKAGNEHVTPVLPPVREALEAWRKKLMAAGEGSPWIFPAFESEGHVRGDVVHGWVLDAEKLAGYEEHEPYFGLHALRRRWAMKRKDLSPVDVAELGGWKNVETLQSIYQRADLAAMERVLEEGEKYALQDV